MTAVWKTSFSLLFFSWRGDVQAVVVVKLPILFAAKSKIRADGQKISFRRSSCEKPVWNVTLSSIFPRLPEFFSWESSLTVFLSLCPLSHSAGLIYLPSLSAASCCFFYFFFPLPQTRASASRQGWWISSTAATSSVSTGAELTFKAPGCQSAGLIGPRRRPEKNLSSSC